MKSNNEFFESIKTNNNKKLFISNETLKQTFSHEFLPIAITTSILAPLNRIKIILQTNRLISINESDKVYKPSRLTASNLYSYFYRNR